MAKPKVPPMKKRTTTVRPRYPRRVQLVIVTIVAVLVVLALVAIQLNLRKTPKKDNDNDGTSDKPPEEGDWIITKEINIEKGDYEVKGNLNITGTGKLTMHNATLLVSCTNLQTIIIESGGELHVFKSTIDFASTPTSCELWAKPGSVLELKDSSTKLALNIDSNSSVVENNVLTGKYTGIMIESGSSTISKNIITGAQGPILPSAIYLTNATRNTISDNRISGFSSGLTLSGSSVTTIRNNTITSDQSTGQTTSAGMQFYSSKDNQISFNEIRSCDVGVDLVDNSTGNTFHHNNFVGNTKQAVDSGTNNFDDGGDGNYWSNYIGFDLNKDGKGDLPYVVSLTDRDNHPFMKPIKRP